MLVEGGCCAVSLLAGMSLRGIWDQAVVKSVTERVRVEEIMQLSFE